jgi:chorismate synthase
VRAAMKPLSTLKRRLQTVDMATGESAEAFQERTDVCAVPAAGVVCESVVALVLADAVLETFPADTVEALQTAVSDHRARLRERGGRAG